MSATATTTRSPASPLPIAAEPPRRTPRQLATIYALEARYEMLKVLRLPMFAVPTLAFPLVFYCLFGLAFRGGGPGGTPMAVYLLATYGAFGVIGAALFGFGVNVAMERGQGWMLLKRATPMPPGAYFAAKTAVALLFSMLIVIGLFTLGATLGGVRLPTDTWIGLALSLVAGAVPFCAFGLALGYLAGPNSAPAVINLLYLPMAFASGLWLPVEALPGWMQQIAPWLPAYYLAQLGLGALGLPVRVSAGAAVAALAAFTVISLAIARLGYRRDHGRTYG
ncbi:MAG TPA: ABC transporter permease [Thermoanaerobaculia bacterium]|nr:ABC transporter permease [Thermoanaerobaculia bacterium]